MRHHVNHFCERPTEVADAMPADLNPRAVSQSLRRIKTSRASWEVCPKHQNSRRENQRVQGRGSQRRALLPPTGRGFRSLRHRLSAADAHAARLPGGFCVTVIFFHMKPTEPDSNPRQTRAAAYVRMSTEHQQFSAHNQCGTINEHSARCGIDDLIKEKGFFTACSQQTRLYIHPETRFRPVM